MKFWWSLLAVLACVPDTTPAVFRSPYRRCPHPDHVCVHIWRCAAPEYRAEVPAPQSPWRRCALPAPLHSSEVCCPMAEQPVTSAPPASPRSMRQDRHGQPAVGSRPSHSSPDTLRQANAEFGIDAQINPRLPRQVSDSGDFSLPPSSEAAAVGGGELDARPGKWRWMVVFGRWSDAGLGDWFCGGTLISDRHVLTTSHCLQPEDAGAIGARIGDDDLRIRSEVDHQQRNVSSVVQHPLHVGSQNDLAVVRLAEPVELTADVQPISLPPAGAEHVGHDVEAAGWGTLQFGGETSDILHEVPLRVTDPLACETAYRDVPLFDTHFPGGFKSAKVCAESRDERHRDACEGDSGGPLTVRLEDGSYQLLGVLSAGFGCGDPAYPGIYTKVSAYIDWINGQLH